MGSPDVGTPDGDSSDDGSSDSAPADGGAGDSADSGSQPPSCAARGSGMTNCGAGGSGTESCCTSLGVEGGTFYRTYANDGGGPSGEADPATVSGFRFDKYEVTVGRFRQFVKAVLPGDGGAGWTPPAGSGKHTHLNAGLGLANSSNPGTFETGWVATDDGEIAPTDANLACPIFATWTPSAGNNENRPITCANSREAYAFCIWDGGFLPSEAEWEYAAAGGSAQLLYPWGSADPGTDSQYAIYGAGTTDCYYPSGTLMTCTGAINFAPVGTPSLGAGRWGQLDLQGNAAERVLDRYGAFVDPCTDCANLALPYFEEIAGCDTTTRPSITDLHGISMGRWETVGFRCARTP